MILRTKSWLEQTDRLSGREALKVFYAAMIPTGVTDKGTFDAPRIDNSSSYSQCMDVVLRMHIIHNVMKWIRLHLNNREN